MILNVIQLVLSALLLGAIMLQPRGTGVGLAFGGDGNVYRTRRGIEKRLHVLTIILVVLFFVVSVLNTLFTF